MFNLFFFNNIKYISIYLNIFKYVYCNNKYTEYNNI